MNIRKKCNVLIGAVIMYVFIGLLIASFDLLWTSDLTLVDILLRVTFTIASIIFLIFIFGTAKELTEYVVSQLGEDGNGTKE